jgi:hypothetical protein
MSRFAPGASFAVVSQKDGSFAVEVHEPKRAVPLRITGYASEAEAKTAIDGFTATKPIEQPGAPVALTKPVEDIATAQPADAVENERDQAAAVIDKKPGAAPAKSPTKKQRAGIPRRVARKHHRPRG